MCLKNMSCTRQPDSYHSKQLKHTSNIWCVHFGPSLDRLPRAEHKHNLRMLEILELKLERQALKIHRRRLVDF